jgi:hypothetical protein
MDAYERVTTMDLHYPPQAESGVLLPAVVIVAGYPDVGVPNILGCKFKEMEMNTSWGQLISMDQPPSLRPH